MYIRIFLCFVLLWWNHSLRWFLWFLYPDQSKMLLWYKAISTVPLNLSWIISVNYHIRQIATKPDKAQSDKWFFERIVYMYVVWCKTADELIFILVFNQVTYLYLSQNGSRRCMNKLITWIYQRYFCWLDPLNWVTGFTRMLVRSNMAIIVVYFCERGWPSQDVDDTIQIQFWWDLWKHFLRCRHD